MGPFAPKDVRFKQFGQLKAEQKTRSKGHGAVEGNRSRASRSRVKMNSHFLGKVSELKIGLTWICKMELALACLV